VLRVAREPVRAAAYAERGHRTAQEYAWPTVARKVIGLYRSRGVDG
jgi:hypothetical protein